MKVQILHGRDPDSECELTVFVDGQRIPDADVYVEDIDPGRGYEDWAWEERIDESRSDTTEFGQLVTATLEQFSGTGREVRTLNDRPKPTPKEATLRYLITYNQTPSERYDLRDNNMNEDARRLIQAYGLEIEGEEGGTNFVTGGSDQSFVVKGRRATVKAAAKALSEQLDRQVDFEKAC